MVNRGTSIEMPNNISFTTISRGLGYGLQAGAVGSPAASELAAARTQRDHCRPWLLFFAENCK